MKEFLYETLIEPFTEEFDWFMWFFTSFFWLVSIALVIGFVWLNVWLIDSSFLQTKEGSGVIVNRFYRPDWDQLYFLQVGNVSVPQYIHHNESYGITININGITDDVNLYKDNWEMVEIGQTICCQYTEGRIRDYIYIKSFCD